MGEKSNNIPEILTTLLHIHNLTQEQLANKINVSTATISCIIQGKRDPSSSTITKLCNYFDVSADYLLYGTPNHPREAKGKEHVVDALSKLVTGVKRTLELTNGLCFAGLDGSAISRIEDPLYGALEAFSGDLHIVKSNESCMLVSAVDNNTMTAKEIAEYIYKKIKEA